MVTARVTNSPAPGAELGPNGPNLPETNQDHSGLLGARGARRANKSARFETGSDERGSSYAVSKTGGWGSSPSTPAIGTLDH